MQERFLTKVRASLGGFRDQDEVNIAIADFNAGLSVTQCVGHIENTRI